MFHFWIKKSYKSWKILNKSQVKKVATSSNNWFIGFIYRVSFFNTWRVACRTFINGYGREFTSLRRFGFVALNVKHLNHVVADKRGGCVAWLTFPNLVYFIFQKISSWNRKIQKFKSQNFCREFWAKTYNENCPVGL